MKASVLSTRKLTRGQRELLLNAGMGLVEKDFISIVPLEFSVVELPRNLIFTSQNTVTIFDQHFKTGKPVDRNIFCVGEKTAALLSEKGYSVRESAHYGAELAQIIVERYKEEEFMFFCGKKRNPNLPEALLQNNIRFTEKHIYDTLFTPTKIDRIFEGVLFFSPSGVKSYCKENVLTESTAFCIGTTTAAEAEKHTSRIVLATKPTIENVIVQVIRHFG